MNTKDMLPIKKELQAANKSLDLIRELIANTRNHVFHFSDGKKSGNLFLGVYRSEYHSYFFVILEMIVFVAAVFWQTNYIQKLVNKRAVV